MPGSWSASVAAPGPGPAAAVAARAPRAAARRDGRQCVTLRNPNLTSERAPRRTAPATKDEARVPLTIRM